MSEEEVKIKSVSQVSALGDELQEDGTPQDVRISYRMP